MDFFYFVRQGCFFFGWEGGATLQTFVFKWSQPGVGKPDRKCRLELLDILIERVGGKLVCERR